MLPLARPKSTTSLQNRSRHLCGRKEPLSHKLTLKRVVVAHRLSAADLGQKEDIRTGHTRISHGYADADDVIIRVCVIYADGIQATSSSSSEPRDGSVDDRRAALQKVEGGLFTTRKRLALTYPVEFVPALRIC